MRKIVKYAIILIIGFIFGYLLVNIIGGYSDKKEAEARIQTLPEVDFLSFYGDSVSLHSFDPTKPLLLVYFHPDCEHCQYEAQAISQTSHALNECQLVMVTADDSLQRVKRFCNTNQLWEVNNIEVLIDTENKFKPTFGKAVIPSIYIYENRKLTQQFLGETKIESILNALNNN
ncbi:redoxin domain-containing protein [Prolixibacteraceae bacterium Z1-6]|uniref:Redoxin domain-containing protein n=1 Tax=Draconibacterium aestuarii TaxID=2998507 RepID=A0A9X3J842_9BACT|nr:redoxin domain-containing protein [Prolixibacteraceae bacterium Z1-6]